MWIETFGHDQREQNEMHDAGMEMEQQEFLEWMRNSPELTGLKEELEGHARFVELSSIQWVDKEWNIDSDGLKDEFEGEYSFVA